MKQTFQYSITITSEKYGNILSESFMDPTQFKIFLKMVDGAINLNEPLSYFDGNTFLIYIPSKILKESLIITNTKEVSLVEQVRNKIETLV